MTDKNTKKVVIDSDPKTPTFEGEAYPDGLLPGWKHNDERKYEGRDCRSLDARNADTGSQTYGKRVNIGLIVSIESLRELKEFHGVDALEFFIAEASRDFEERLRVAIANEKIDAGFTNSIDVQQEQASFDMMRRVYGISNEACPKDCVEEGLGSDDVSHWHGVPGYHFSFAAGTIDADLIMAEHEGGLDGLMKRIGELINEQS